MSDKEATSGVAFWLVVHHYRAESTCDTGGCDISPDIYELFSNAADAYRSAGRVLRSHVDTNYIDNEAIRQTIHTLLQRDAFELALACWNTYAENGGSDYPISVHKMAVDQPYVASMSDMNVSN